MISIFFFIFTKLLKHAILDDILGCDAGTVNLKHAQSEFQSLVRYVSHYPVASHVVKSSIH